MTLPGFHDRAHALAELPALGLLTLAGMLPEHWNCSYRAPAGVDEELVEAIVSERPTLVAISALTASIVEAYSLSLALRQRGIRTAIGGLHATALPEEAQRYADAVVAGSGETVWLTLLDDLERGELQPVYRAGRSNEGVPWPMPRFDLLGDVKRYTLQTQRSCPLACDFCAASRLLERFREKPIDVIRDELAALNECADAPLLELADDNTFAGSRNPLELLEVLKNSRARWFTEADWRIGERPEIVRELAASGCMQVLVGIESMNFRYPGMGEKEAELNRMLEATHALQEAGVCVNGCFILGAEGETQQSIERLTRFLLEAPFAEVQVTLQTPYPGTALYSRLKRQNRLLTNRSWPYYTLFEVTYQPDQLSVIELETGFRELITHVYGPAANRRRKQHRLNIWRRNPRLRSGN